MNDTGVKNPSSTLTKLGFKNTTANWNISRDALIQRTLELNLGVLNDSGALCIDTAYACVRVRKVKIF